MSDRTSNFTYSSRNVNPFTGLASQPAPDMTPTPLDEERRYHIFEADYSEVLRAIRRMYREGERMPWFTRAFDVLTQPSLAKQETALSTLWTALGIESNAPTTDRPTAEVTS